MTQDAAASQAPASRRKRQRLHIAGIAAVSIAVAAHLAGGGALLHLDPGGVLRNLSGGALAIAVVAIVVIKVLLIHATRRALSRR